MLSLTLLSSALLLHGMTMNQPPPTEPSSAAEHGPYHSRQQVVLRGRLSMETLIVLLLLLTIPGPLTCLPSRSTRD